MRLICWGVLALPFAANSSPITDPRYHVDIEIWGTITAVGETGGWTVGQALNRTIRVDTSLAPADRWSDPQAGYYTWNPYCEGRCPPPLPAPSEFVSALGNGVRGESNDEVRVFDGSDGLFLRDFETSIENGMPHSQFFSAEVHLPIDFIHGDGLDQQFDVRPSSDAQGRGEFTEIYQGMTFLYSFVVERMRAAPRLCRP